MQVLLVQRLLSVYFTGLKLGFALHWAADTQFNVLTVLACGNGLQVGEELLLDYGSVYWTGREDEIVS